MILSASALNSCMIEFSIPDYNNKNYQKYFQTLNVVSCVPYAMVHRSRLSVLQWTRGERVPLSLYEGTFFAVLHFHFMTAFQRRPKRRRVFPFPNNHRRPSKVLTTLLLTFFSTFSIRPSVFFFLFLQRLFLLFFLLLVYGLAFPHFFAAQQVMNAAGLGVRIG